MTHREELLRIVMEKSFRRGDFTLSSGQKSNYYIDGKQTTLDARGSFLVGRIMLAMMSDDVPQAVGGLTLGADPIVGAITAIAGMEDLPLKGFIVRKEAKGHGTKSRIEGPLDKGDRVVIVEDVVTTGGASLKAVEAVRAFGCEVDRILALVDREQGGKENLREQGCRLESIFFVSELLNA
jgi:orotate phosphoribosyltransferase